MYGCADAYAYDLRKGRRYSYADCESEAGQVARRNAAQSFSKCVLIRKCYFIWNFHAQLSWCNSKIRCVAARRCRRGYRILFFVSRRLCTMRYFKLRVRVPLAYLRSKRKYLYFRTLSLVPSHLSYYWWSEYRILRYLGDLLGSLAMFNNWNGYSMYLLLPLFEWKKWNTKGIDLCK